RLLVSPRQEQLDVLGVRDAVLSRRAVAEQFGSGLGSLSLRGLQRLSGPLNVRLLRLTDGGKFVGSILVFLGALFPLARLGLPVSHVDLDLRLLGLCRLDSGGLGVGV